MRIIYFDIDSLRPDHLGCYGYDRPTSPTIDRIASEGMRFNHYYCASSPCLPSRAAFVSGRFGIRNGILAHYGPAARMRYGSTPWNEPGPHNQPFPRQLRAAGYDTISFSNFVDRHAAFWFTHGFSEFHTTNLKRGRESAAEVNAKLLPWLRQNAAGDNYFIHINYWDAHRCYNVDPAWSQRFDDHPVTQSWPDQHAIDEHQSLTGYFTAKAQFPDGVSTTPLMPGAIRTRADFEHLITGYDTAIAYADAHVQQVLDELERQGVLDETVIIISADHGEGFGEHGIYSDHTNVGEAVQRIPLIVRWPGVTPHGTASDAFMYNVDFAPTLCDMLDAPISEDWDGKSYKANLFGEQGEDRDILVWDSGCYTLQRAVRTRTHLYIRTYDPFHYDHWPEALLYDVIADPYETCNLTTARPDIVQSCHNALEDWMEQQTTKRDWVSDPLDAIPEERAARLAASHQ